MTAYPDPSSESAPDTASDPGLQHAEEEAVALTSELIRYDTTNTGDPATVAGERAAAEFVASKLGEAGYEVTYVESGDHPGRANVIARLPGADSRRGGLLVHGHLDVVPADPAEWSVHPFSGVVQDGYVWGRGAVDMKDMLAMSLAVARRFKRDGITPPRDIVFAFLADEEAGSFHGAQWLADHRPELFAGCTEAISEVGGYSVTLQDDVRAYLVQTAEKGIRWLTLRVRARAGHGSMVHEDNAVTRLAAAVARLGEHRFPVVLTDSVREFLDGVSELTGWDFPADDLDGSVAKLGNLSRIVGATLRDIANPTMLNAGYKHNVIPSVAEAAVDCRILPGREEVFDRELAEVLGPDVEREWVGLPPVETPFEGRIVDVMAESLRAEDPAARTLPYMMSGGTDAKSFSRLGMNCYGFAPLKLPADLDFTALFHGVDERVPTEALRFGTRVLDRFLRSS
ncbi:acetylornithine deacetylase/succinyl-diaminopimelate desuccinylase-like protein [Halopolyspora algeriensis]|uniref:Acetylornithine deacetylase/succinyl-diaminopimelate desuccinylase-like protein n=1 Tax=Halopolyspora algeriensis TaxID=1500506 RepID=A0A368VH46_9ACTN|nr:M20/M25/M40 family metallo-hydrolase [Halopolyspora algeriensis]RCW40507.1 acetylornithine deacetylase/succinyl-diaminopimelate desuccinylase-like protein [Halopolyspora algeriensis]TQM53790.1 acetylornithine deacetylase/succinyl-diaminopimelate desuccinylase-like protein [Halopolyspora algeriensis]